MPQIAILPVAPAQAPEVNMPSSSSSEDFAPHLAQAVNKQNKPQDAKSTSDTKKEATASKDDQQVKDSEKQPSDEDGQQTVKADQDKGPAQDDGTEVQQLQTASQEKAQTASENSTKAENNFFSSLASKLLAAEMDSDNLDPELTEFIKSAVSNTSKGQVMSAVTSAATNNEEKSALLAQLQQIIENSSETGTVSIKRGNGSTLSTGLNAANSTSLLNATTTTQQQQVNTTTSSTLTDHLLAVNVDGMQKAGDATAEQITAQRQSTQQQYLDAKLTLQASSDSADDSTEQNSSSSDQSTTSQNGQQVATTAFSSTDTTGIFSVAATSTAQTATASTPLPTTAETITLPSGTMLQENEVLQQIAERFQVAQRMTDTHINIKLHPAELGELKIDLTVKDGSIRAHVIAQSQQVQEIIERNMAKLKVSLEDQGFTLDEITVATQSDSVGQFDLFDGELAQQNEFTQGNTRSQKISAALYQNEEFPDLPIDNQTGVNLTI